MRLVQILIEKVRVAQLVKKFSAFSETRGFSSVLTGTCPELHKSILHHPMLRLKKPSSYYPVVNAYVQSF